MIILSLVISNTHAHNLEIPFIYAYMHLLLINRFLKYVGFEFLTAVVIKCPVF
jgi:hypothetical protein